MSTNDINWKRGDELLPTFRCTLGQRHAYVSAYTDHPDSGYNWQVYIYGVDERMSDSLPTADEAKSHVERLMTMPDDEFNPLMVGVLTKKLNRITDDIIRLSPTSGVLPGFAAGVEAERARIKAMLFEESEAA